MCFFFFSETAQECCFFFSLLMFASHSFDTSPKSRVDHVRNIVHLHSYTFLSDSICTGKSAACKDKSVVRNLTMSKLTYLVPELWCNPGGLVIK